MSGVIVSHKSAFLVVALALAGQSALAADQAWTRDMTSTGLQTLGARVPVAFKPDTRSSIVPANARITRIYASSAYAGTARIATDLCWGSPKGPCVPLQGSRIDSHAFDGRSARGPMWLVHRVVGWGTAHPPLFVRGTVTVWFTEDTR